MCGILGSYSKKFHFKEEHLNIISHRGPDDKGYFFENYIMDIELQRKLNVEFLLHIFRFNSKIFGIKKLTDFYPTNNNTTISWSRLFQRLIAKITHYD